MSSSDYPASSDASATRTTKTTGSCLCREVKYEISGEPIHAVMCHCDNCQKASGTAFLQNLFFRQSQITLYDPHHHLQWYQDTLTTTGKPLQRGFCNACGSSLCIKPASPPGKEPFFIVCSGGIDDVHLKTGKWLPSVEGFTQPFKRSWLGEAKGVKTFDKTFRFKL